MSVVLAVQASLAIGGATFRVLHYAVRQALFEVGTLVCDAVQDDHELPDPATLVGHPATLTLAVTDGGATRLVCGIVAVAERAPAQDGVPHLELQIVPAMWRLSQRADCRVFLKKSVDEIVRAVLTGAGVEHQAWKLEGSYAKRDHVTQYRETDLEFVMRLCAEEGIYFWMQPVGENDTAHFADNPKGVGPIEGNESLVFREVFGDHEVGDYVMRVERAQSVVSDKVMLRDFDPDKPKAKLESKVESTDSGAHDLEVYAYPGRFTVKADGDRFARVLLDAIQADRDVVRGEVANLALQPGSRFKIEQHPYEQLNEEYLVVAVDIEGGERRQFAIAGIGGQQHGEFEYACRFTAVPTAKTSYRPPRRPRARVMPGLQTAVTAGPSGEEIHSDAGGHVKAQFHWDRLGQRDDTASRWMRTSQLALGGAMLIPRAGWEVAVRFNEGDADNPYVMARLYNGATPPPYALPKHKGRGSLQTATTPGGGSVNEFHMSDEKGQESFFMNASKDMTVQVNNNTTESVGNNSDRNVIGNQKFSVTNSSSAAIGVNQSITVTGDQTVHVETFMVDQVAGNHTLQIGGDRTMMIGGDHKRDVAGNSTLTVQGMMLDAVIGDVTDSTLGNMNHTVGAALVELTGGSRSYTVGGSRDEKTTAVKIIASKGGRGVDVSGSFNQTVGGAIIHSVTNDRAETAGAMYTEVAAGAHIVKADEVTYEAETMLTLVMGASTVTMLPAMVTIAGVSVKCDGDVADTAALISDN